MAEQFKMYLDLETLEELQMIMEDDFSLLINTFMSDGADRLSDLEQGMSAQDAEAVRRAAHSFKGSSSNVGATHLTELCYRMEQAAKGNNLADGPSLLSDIKQSFEQSSHYLTEYLKNQP